LIEVLSPCPTIWKKDAVQSQKWVKDVMEKTYPLGILCDRTKEREPRTIAAAAPRLEELPRLLGVQEEVVEQADGCSEGCSFDSRNIDLEVRIAGFGGQGVLLLGEVLAEAGLDAGLEVSWLPSYGPEMRSGTSNCHVRLSSEPIDSPLVARPQLLVAMNEPSLRKLDKSVRSGGWVLYNGDEFPEDCRRDDVHVLALPFLHFADELGDPRACNMVMLGALLEKTNVLPQGSVEAALRRLVKSSRWVELDLKAIARGRGLMQESLKETPRETLIEV
jgi:2-oxoisovalerate ferredoxin oxidoreductase beta subunit